MEGKIKQSVISKESTLVSFEVARSEKRGRMKCEEINAYMRGRRKKTKRKGEGPKMIQSIC
jgi:hypothetical protein